jgi:inner membrane transporter RhtA
LLSAVAQYTGATIATLLFDEVAPRTVAWLRVAGAAAVLILVSPGALRHWSRRQLLTAAAFGIATALMNTLFFLGLARTDLGKSVAIEFIGPIAVAAVMTRTARNAAALSLATLGVVVLGGVEVGDNTVGLLWILAASAMWALYIVIGSRVAQIGRGVAGLGIGLAIGALVITPIGAPGSADVFTTPRLLIGCVLVGVFSNAIGYGIDQYVMRRIPVRRFSVLLALLPVTAVAFGWIALDQVPSTVEFAGIGLVLVGVVLQEREELPQPAMADAP